MILTLAPSTSLRAIPQQLQQGGGHQGESAHMRLLPDVTREVSHGCCTVVFTEEEFPNHLTRSDILDESIWSFFYSYTGVDILRRQIMHTQVDITYDNMYDYSSISDHKHSHRHTQGHIITRRHTAAAVSGHRTCEVCSRL